MKKLFLIAVAMLISVSVYSQSQSNRGNEDVSVSIKPVPAEVTNNNLVNSTPADVQSVSSMPEPSRKNQPCCVGYSPEDTGVGKADAVILIELEKAKPAKNIFPDTPPNK